MHRIEHLVFASNMEATFSGWLQQPWHILYSALRCMACQEWQQQHVCPISRKSDRNIGGVHNAWAYFDGCITHLSTAPKCIGLLLNEDPLTGKGKSLIPSVATMLAELYPNKSTRDYLPFANHHLHGTWRPSTVANVHFGTSKSSVLVGDCWPCLAPKQLCRRTNGGVQDIAVDQR